MFAMAFPPPPPPDPRFGSVPPPPPAPRFEVLPPSPGILPQQRPAAPGKKSGMMGGGVAAIFVLLAKAKLLLFPMLKTGLSMLLMIWIYSMAFGWLFAAGFVLLIFLHEMGHVIAAKWLGIPVSAPLFIPFLGAAIVMKQNPRDAWTEALMAYGGPLAGCLGAWACLVLADQLQVRWLVAVASATFVINLFNMIPVPPLDGGRICAAVTPWFWFLGVILLGAALFFFHAGSSIILLVIILFFALPRLKATLFQPHTPEMQQYYATAVPRRLLMAALYLALIGVMLFGYWDASQQLADLWPDNSGT
jgi:Zn-dependent protease